MFSATFYSPLPPAEFLESYRNITPDAPKRLMELFVQQVEHRIESERTDLKARIHLRIVGQILGIIFALSALIAGTIVALYGSASVSGIIFGTTIPFCAIIFVLGREPKNSKSLTPLKSK